MSESKKTKEAVNEDENWSILPFDEAEDDKRWAKLTSELEQLEKDVAEYEATFGYKILMNEPLKEIQNEVEQTKLGDLF